MISGSLWNYYRDEIDGVNEMLRMLSHLNITKKNNKKTPKHPPQPLNE